MVDDKVVQSDWDDPAIVAKGLLPCSVFFLHLHQLGQLYALLLLSALAAVHRVSFLFEGLTAKRASSSLALQAPVDEALDVEIVAAGGLKVDLWMEANAAFSFTLNFPFPVPPNARSEMDNGVTATTPFLTSTSGMLKFIIKLLHISLFHQDGAFSPFAIAVSKDPQGNCRQDDD